MQYLLGKGIPQMRSKSRNIISRFDAIIARLNVKYIKYGCGIVKQF